MPDIMPFPIVAPSSMVRAACDLGTVTSRLLIGRVLESGVQSLYCDTVITNLGEGLNASGLISAAAQARLVAVLLRFRKAAEDFGAEHTAKNTEEEKAMPLSLHIVATSALRDARNSGTILAELHRQGFGLRVLSGEQEARLAFWGTLSGFAELRESVLSIDIGGGSTEVVIGRRKLGKLVNTCAILQKPQINLARSFDVGSRRVTEMFLLADPPTAEQLGQARQWIDAQLGDPLRALSDIPDQVIAVAGTATTAITIRDAIREYDRQRVHGVRLSAAELDELIAMLATLPLARRKKIVGLHPDRAAVIVGGLLILRLALSALKRDSLLVSDTDILQGVLLEAAAKSLEIR